MPKKRSAKNKKIKAVLFDLGKVIIHFDFTQAFVRLSQASTLTPAQISDYFRRAGLEVLYDAGKITSHEFYKAVKKGTAHSLDYKAFKKVWNEIFTLKTDVVRLIKKLSPHYRLVLVSNTNHMHYEYIRKRYTVLNHFDRLILSYRERVRKPDERIYRVASRACKAKPHEILYIDDREDLTDAAKELGFNIFTYKNNTAALLSEMRRLGIRC